MRVTEHGQTQSPARCRHAMSTATVTTTVETDLSQSFERIEGLLADAVQGTLEVACGNQPVIRGYRLEQQIGHGPDGLAYSAWDLQAKRRVEYLQLAPKYQEAELQEQLRVQVARLAYVQNPVIRRVLHIELDKDQFVVCEPSHRSWHDWCSSNDFEAQSYLLILKDICHALLDLRRCGVPVVGPLKTKISILGCRPRLDPLHLDCQGTGPQASAEILCSQEDDLSSFVSLLREAMNCKKFENLVGKISAPLLAQLRQLLRQGNDTEALDAPTLSEYQKVLDDLAKFIPTEHATDEKSPAALCSADAPAGTIEVANVGSLDLRVNSYSGSTKDQALLGANAAQAIHGDLHSGDQLGRYEIVAKLGEGGMGAVFRARDITNNQQVAIKVLHRAAQLKTQALRRFQKEARVLAALKNPHITNLIEVNEEAGRHYIVLEYVEGIDLHRALKHHGPLPPRVALSIVADAARGLLDAHQRDMIHRDIKPENILLEQGDRWLAGETNAFVPRARLTDFGIARQIDQSQSLAMTQAGGLLGTPLYMSPEQCKGSEVGPQADVYSLGVTLFQMLTGRTPFQADEPLKLIGMHCYEPAPFVRQFESRISDTVNAIVAKCLAKDPAARYADAGHLLEALDREIRGEVATVQFHPIVPTAAAGSVYENQMVWELASAPEKLWPLVSNTERLNRAMGLPAVEYQTERDEVGRLRRYAKVSLGGMTMRWEEHPFEWVEGRRMSVLREFTGGPFLWFASIVELEQLPAGGTRLKHTVRMAGRNWFGRLIAKRETGKKCRRALDAVYSRMDKILQNETVATTHQDPFIVSASLKTPIVRRMNARFDQLEERGIASPLVAKLRDYLLHAAPQEIAKIRPLALSEHLGVKTQELIQACLLATDLGLLQMEWDILCPTCRVSAETKGTLKELTAHTNCEACAIDFQSDLANSVELVFRVHQDLIDTRLGKYCIGGPSHTPHVVAQVRCEPQERIELSMTLSVGEYLLRGPNWAGTIPLKVVAQGAPTRLELEITQQTTSKLVPTLRAGQQVLIMANQTELPQILRLERTIARQNVITATQAMALPGFRELFPGEILDQGQLISAENVTLLATRVANIDDCYTKHGDRATFSMIQQQLKLLQETTQHHRGDVVKVVGEGLLAVFGDVQAGVQAAFQVVQQISAIPELQHLQLVVGVHRGPAIVTTVNQRLDYFGAAARQVQVLPQLIRQGIVLSESVYTDPLVQDFLHTQAAPEIRLADLPGREQELLQVFSS
jgi:class 3 adenylate cyclase/tRNA A-37 threonylcarbamoyl transferase component Bud32